MRYGTSVRCLYDQPALTLLLSLETTCAAATSGVRSLCAMKHVGLNVAADAFMTLAYVGVRAGMLLVCADDPSLHSSQNEQDNRYYAKMAGVPMLEPATPEEAKAMVLHGLELSEKYRIPVMLRTPTRDNHCRGPVSLGIIPRERPLASFPKDPLNLVVVPMVGRKLRLVLLEKMAGLQKEAESSPLNFRTGGLADSVRHFDRATGEGTGIVFIDADAGAVRWAIGLLGELHADRAAWARLIANGMSEDFGWGPPFARYLRLYARAREQAR